MKEPVEGEQESVSAQKEEESTQRELPGGDSSKQEVVGSPDCTDRESGNGDMNGEQSSQQASDFSDPRSLKEVVQGIVDNKDGEIEEDAEEGSPKKVAFSGDHP